MIRFTRKALLVAALFCSLAADRLVQAAESSRPNIVLIFTDDHGYADVGVYGAKGFNTPNLDRLAREGVRFTDFYVAQPVCSASRAALLTGCYPNRIGIHGALGPGARHGIHSNEVTIAEVVKPLGYATAIYGKWHVGHHRPFLPPQHGFDEFFGLPYSNDMWPKHPTATFPDLPLMENDRILEYNPDQTKLTTWYTERALKFIEKNKEQPFFLYVAHNMPHVPLFVSEKFQGKSRRGLYGDVIAEIDWSVGQILESLEKHGLDKNTLVIFTSDNGPWLSYGEHGGSAEPLREGKGTTFEGGVRVPCLMRWQGKIPAGSVCREPAMTIDILPTVARLTGGKTPAHRIDGKDIWALISGSAEAKSPHEAYSFYNHGGALEAIRSGRWKLHFPHAYRSFEGKTGRDDGQPVSYAQARTPLALYDLEADQSETRNLSGEHPEVVRRLTALADQCREDLGDSLTRRKGGGAREAGQLAK